MSKQKTGIFGKIVAFIIAIALLAVAIISTACLFNSNFRSKVENKLGIETSVESPSDETVNVKDSEDYILLQEELDAQKQTTLEMKKEYENQLAENQVKITDLENQIENKDEQIAEKETALASVNAELETAKTENAENIELIASLESEKSALETDIETLSTERDNYKNDYDALVVQNQQLQARVEELESSSGTATEPVAMLISGVAFNTKIPTSTTSIVFDKYTSNNTYIVDNVNVIENIEPIDVTHINGTGEKINLYLNGTSAYILSNEIIYFNYTCRTMFRNFSKLSKLNFNNIDTSYTADMSLMFSGCINLKSLNLSNFNTQNVGDLSYMFQSCSYLGTLDLSNFNTKNVANMSSMFYQCNSLTTLDLSGFDTSKVTDMSQMFYSNKLETLDLSSFDTSKVKNMMNMFRKCEKLKNIYVSELWNISNVSNSNDMFSDSSLLPNFDSSIIDKTNAHTGDGGYLTLKTA